MSNVLQFRQPDHRDEKAGLERPSSSAPAMLDVPFQASRIRTLQASARKDIRDLILMLDIAVMRGRLAYQLIGDRDARHSLESELTVIEELLDLARVKAARL
jgi:hypothetical protein